MNGHRVPAAVVMVLVAATAVVDSTHTVATPPADVGISVAPNPAAGDVSAELLGVLQRDLKVTAEQARARLVRADWATRLDKPLRQQLGDAYAGSWLAENGLEFVVAITDRRLEGLVRASGATPKLVARSEAELNAIGAKLDALADTPGKVPATVVGWVVDPQANQVTVRVRPGGRAAAERFVASAGLRPDHVAYQVTNHQAQLMGTLDAGLRYHLFQANSPTCTAGFAVTHPDPGPAAFLTAAHCFLSTGSTQAFGRTTFEFPDGYRQMGSLMSWAHGVDHDEALVRVIPEHYIPVPRVHGYGRIPDILVGDGVEVAGGAPVCTSGGRSFLQCGRTRSGWFTFPAPSGPVHKRLRATDTCGGPGDSGGPVISVTGNHAQGHVIGGIFPCPWFSIFRETYYIPLKRSLDQLGARLQTARVPTAPPIPSPAPHPKWTTGKQFWNGIGGVIDGKVASVSLAANHLQLFGRSSDNRLYTNTLTNTAWGGWQGLGDLTTAQPTVLARAGGIDVFYRGGDTRAYWRRFNGTAWEAPVRLGDLDINGPIAAVSPHPGHAILFARGSDNQVRYNFTDGVAPWSGWLSLGGDVNAAPTAIARTNTSGQVVLEVYARWADDNVRYRRLDPGGPPGWQPWVNLGGIWQDTPVGVSVGTDHSFLIGWGRDNTAYVQRWHNGDWSRGADGGTGSGWRGLGGNMASQPTAIAGPGNQVRVFARDANQRINMITWPGTGIFWESWVTLEGDTTQPVAVSARAGAGPGRFIDAVGIDVATREPFHTAIDVSASTPDVTINETASTVGEPGYFTVTGPPGAPISWSSTLNGAPTGEDHAFYGHHLDGNGTFTWCAGDWSSSATGSWVRQAHVGSQTQQTAQVAYSVSHRPAAVHIDNAQYEVGENISYAVTGPPNQPVLWTSTVNGQPSGESNAFYGQHTDANGVFTFTVPWTDGRAGTWTKHVSVGGQTGQVSFEILRPQTRVTLTAVHSGKCLDVAAFSQDDGGGVHQWTCHGGTNQQWRLDPVGPHTYLLAAVHSGKCLDVSAFSEEDGAPVYQWGCHGATNQQWRLSGPPVSGQTVTLTAVHSGKCLDVSAFSQSDGAPVYQWGCHGATNQQWRVTLLP